MALFQGNLPDPNLITPEQLAEQRRYADFLMGQSTQPVRHWTEGLANMARALMGGYQGYQGDQMDRARALASQQALLPPGMAGGMGNMPMAPQTASGGQGSPVPNDAARRAMSYFISQGYSPAQAAGIAGGLGAESRYDPNAVGDAGTAYGIAQWRGPRQEALRQFAQARGTTPDDIATQMAFVNEELRGPEKRASAALMGAKTPEEAAVAMQHYFRPAGYTPSNPAGGMATDRRIALARGLAQSAPEPDQVMALAAPPPEQPLAQMPPGAPTPQQRIAQAFQALPPNQQPLPPQAALARALQQGVAAPQPPASGLPPAAGMAQAQQGGAGLQPASPPVPPSMFGNQKQTEAWVRGLLRAPPGSPAQQMGIQLAQGLAQKELAPPTWGVIGEDQFGQKMYGWINPAKQQISPYSPAGQGQGQGIAGPISDLHGEEFLQKLDKPIAGIVKQMVEARMPMPSSFALKTPYWNRMLQLAQQYDPEFDATKWQARLKTRSEFAAGGPSSPAAQITAGNTAIQHASDMADAADKMKQLPGTLTAINNAGIPFISYAAGRLKNASVRGTAEGSALKEFVDARNHFAEEVTKFYAGSAGSEAERTRALTALDEAGSLPELHAAIRQEMQLMKSKVGNLQERWKTGMGPMAGEFPLIHPKTQEALDKIETRYKATREGATPPTAPSAPAGGLGQAAPTPASSPIRIPAGMTPEQIRKAYPSGTRFYLPHDPTQIGTVP